MIRWWGDPPKRQFRRSPTDSSVALCSGIRAICHFTELASQEDPEADAQAIRDGNTVPLLRIPTDSTSQSLWIEIWQVLNQSANGLRMHREAGGKVTVTVGEIVGVRFVGGKTWNVGIVRWLTLLEGDALEFGELVARSADSIVIEPTIGSSGRPNPALRLHPLVPGGPFAYEHTIIHVFSGERLYVGDGTQAVRGGSFLESPLRARSAAREQCAEGQQAEDLGLRPARNIDG